MDESRKQFAEAFEELTGWELEDYPNQDYADTCWEFWKKSRAAIELEMPEPFKLAKSSSTLTYYYQDEVDAVLSCAGIKVKE
ncbi:hypothetical protein LWU38_10160 [Enterobacter hormaechei]|nr:hypothetical protein [Enterobacter hormaechei]